MWNFDATQDFISTFSFKLNLQSPVSLIYIIFNFVEFYQHIRQKFICILYKSVLYQHECLFILTKPVWLLDEVDLDIQYCLAASSDNIIVSMVLHNWELISATPCSRLHLGLVEPLLLPPAPLPPLPACRPLPEDLELLSRRGDGLLLLLESLLSLFIIITRILFNTFCWNIMSFLVTNLQF